MDAVNNWLISAGIAAEKISQSVNKQWIQFDASTEDLEFLLNTKYHVYEHTETGKTTVACDEYATCFLTSKTSNSFRYHIPPHIQQHVDYITPSIKLFTPQRRGSARRAVEGHIERRDFKLPPLLKDLGMTLEALLAIPELLVCSVAVTPACVQSMYLDVVRILVPY